MGIDWRLSFRYEAWAAESEKMFKARKVWRDLVLKRFPNLDSDYPGHARLAQAASSKHFIISRNCALLPPNPHVPLQNRDCF